MSKIRNNAILKIILLFSFIALCGAYYIEYILGHKPCNLCTIERIPYFFGIFIISLVIILKRFEKNSLILLSLIFFLGTIVSFYHFGIEQGFFKESIVCDLNSEEISASKKDLLKELERKTISCKDVPFKILGFSLATINAIVSAVISIILFRKFINYENN